MGLAEKRATAVLKEKFDGEWKKRIDAAAHCQLPFEVAWETIVKDGTADSAEQAFQELFVSPLAEAFKRICTDQMAQEAVKDGIKKVVIKNSGECTSFLGAGLAFQNGVLSMDHRFTNIDQVEERVRALVKSISSAL